MGSTTYNIGEMLRRTVLFEHRGGIWVGKDDKQKNKMFGMYSSALDYLPWWMKPRIKSFQTGEVIDFDERDEALRAIRPGLKTVVNWEQANKPSGAGRGDTFNVRIACQSCRYWMNGRSLQSLYSDHEHARTGSMSWSPRRTVVTTSGTTCGAGLRLARSTGIQSSFHSSGAKRHTPCQF